MSAQHELRPLESTPPEKFFIMRDYAQEKRLSALSYFLLWKIVQIELLYVFGSLHFSKVSGAPYFEFELFLEISKKVRQSSIQNASRPKPDTK